MKSFLLSFPKARRLEAYKTAGNHLAENRWQFSCHALADALRVPGPDDEKLEADFWGTFFGCVPAIRHTGHTVETRDERWPQFAQNSDPDERVVLYKAIAADALQTRLMMLALIHAVDEAGDLKGILS